MIRLFKPRRSLSFAPAQLKYSLKDKRSLLFITLWNYCVSVNRENFVPEQELMSPSHGPLFSVCLIREELCLLWFPPQVLADAVSHLVVDKFSELTDNFTSPHARRKVLAGVVMTTGDLLVWCSALVKIHGVVDYR